MASRILYIKNSVFIIGLLSIMLSSQAQNTIEVPEYQWAPDTVIYETANGELERKIYSYNEQASQYSELLQTWLDSNWVNNRLFIRNYNDTSRSLTYTSMTWNEGWQKWSQQITVYDLHNNLIENIYQFAHGEDWKNESRRVILYDSIKNQKVCLYQKWKNKKWKNKERDIYQYDTNHTLIYKIWEKRKNSKWRNPSRRSYEYDNNKNLTKEIYYGRYEAGQFRYITQDLYTYDEKNNKLSRQFQAWENNKWENSSQTIYSYNEKGLEESQLEQSWRNNSWGNDNQSLFTYDQNNNQVRKLYQLWRNNNWEDFTQQISIYNDMGNKIIDISQVWVNNKWETYLQFIHNLDTNNNMPALEYWENAPKRDGSSKRDGCSKYVYNYDEYGNRTQGTCWNWENNTWKKADDMIFLPYNKIRSNKFLLSHYRYIHKMTASYIKIPKSILFLFEK